MFDLVDAFTHGADPALEVFSYKFVGGTVLGIDLECKAAQGTAVATFGLEDAVAVAREDGEDAFDGLFGLSECWIDDHRTKCVEITGEDFAQEGLFAFEEVVEAAGVDVGVSEEVRHAGACESPFPKEIAGGGDETVARGWAWGHSEKVLDRVSIRRFT
jgi:hypothetical protein